MKEILSHPEVSTAVSLLVVALVGYLTHRVNNLKEKSEAENKRQCLLMESTKRVALRSEYLNIINSPQFTNSQKYMMTRYLIDDYERLEGNHYIHGLDAELKIKMEQRPDEVN